LEDSRRIPLLRPKGICSGNDYLIKLRGHSTLFDTFLQVPQLKPTFPFEKKILEKDRRNMAVVI
jgi:hypothetical protein